MQFTFQCKKKRCSFRNSNATPLPEQGERYHGVFTGLSVEISEPTQAKSLHDSGCYGKGSKSRGGPASGDEDETLLLGLEESCFLAFYLKVLDIQNLSGTSLGWEEFLKAAKDLNDRFVENLACYLYLKSKNWVIKSGIKFGGDFLIYKQSPQHFHASFLVIVQTPADFDYYQPKNLKGVQRVAETSDKDVLLLTVVQPKEDDSNLATPEALKDISVTETIVRRFNYSSFVQSKQK
ncbi:tRNA-splicing endonuclease subunit Sen2 [Drosophila guanche]|uniref:tRNA-intron lyase n=2 Tax=Drosophila guanche TaxID=7266 RepID=A0A3B0K8C2_DROGU|nr:tRNA-splicing endonuclease subunit Sen2 [Drosophila guanche]SPP82289.1 blast:tRNA-splicing endonuclease subunit Sen2 [Drosophila guanche]